MSRMFFVVESDHHKTRGHQTRVRDVRGSPELHEDEHLPGELWSLVLAKIKVRYCGQSPTMCPPGLLVFIFIHYFIGSTSWHSLANCLLLFVIWLCRYTLPHRRKVSRMGGGNVFWSAKEQVRDSAWKSSIRMFVITEKAPTRAFSWLKAATTPLSHLSHY